MQFGSSARFRTLSSAILRSPWSAFLVVSLLLSLTACGGSMSANQTQSPPLQPLGSGGTGSSDSGSQGTSGGSGSGSSSPAPAQPSGPPGVPDGAHIDEALQTLPNWEWCTATLDGHPCASGLGDATSSMTQGQGDPSLSGKAAEFKLGGPTRYSNALWWKQLGPNSEPTHFVYDVYFYMTDPSAPEALEFDVNQSMNGVRYTWGTECSYRDTGHWDIWNPEAGAWVTTSVACPQVSAKEWHHLTWTVERVNGQAHYISVELDGDVHTVDKYYNPQPHYDGDGVNAAFQLDGNYRQDPYSVWLDNVSLSSW
jgi:hypothetical protein